MADITTPMGGAAVAFTAITVMEVVRMETVTAMAMEVTEATGATGGMAMAAHSDLAFPYSDEIPGQELTRTAVSPIGFDCVPNEWSLDCYQQFSSTPARTQCSIRPQRVTGYRRMLRLFEGRRSHAMK